MKGPLKRARRLSALVSLAPIAALGLGAVWAGCGTTPGVSEYPDSAVPAVDGGVDAPGDGACVGLACGNPDASCVGLQCQQVGCEAGVTTSLSGTVLDPSGKVPLYNAFVYVPNSEPSPIKEGASCDRCDGQLSGRPIAVAATDSAGRFRLENVPVGKDIPLVVQIGKWRRKVVVPAVAACVDTPLDAGLTRLPRNQAEGHIPRIALSTGGADALECLLRKIGLDDAEFGPEGSPARVHLFSGGGYTDNGTPVTAPTALAGGAPLTASTGLWRDAASLGRYDVVLLACEGDENPSSKPEAARAALYDYAKNGGRVFASHYHNYFFSASTLPAVQGLATWTDTRPDPAGKLETIEGTVETSFPKGAAMKAWLQNTGSLSATGGLPIQEARHNIEALGPGSLSWIRVTNTRSGNTEAVQYMSFNTPVGAADAEVCGRVVFSNLHVGAGSTPGQPFPSGCAAGELTPQQKALLFMLFDLSSCVQRDDQPPAPPR
jgi:hypothetical protein